MTLAAGSVRLETAPVTIPFTMQAHRRAGELYLDAACTLDYSARGSRCDLGTEKPGRLDSVEDPKFGVVTTTLANEGDARDLAREIIENRLAACVQLSPIFSTYRWQGNVETSAEHLLTAKTLIVQADALIEFIRTRHTYDVPEIVLVAIIGGSQSYLDWIERETDD